MIKISDLKRWGNGKLVFMLFYVVKKDDSYAVEETDVIVNNSCVKRLNSIERKKGFYAFLNTRKGRGWLKKNEKSISRAFNKHILSWMNLDMNFKPIC